MASITPYHFKEQTQSHMEEKPLPHRHAPLSELEGDTLLDFALWIESEQESLEERLMCKRCSVKTKSQMHKAASKAYAQGKKCLAVFDAPKEDFKIPKMHLRPKNDVSDFHPLQENVYYIEKPREDETKDKPQTLTHGQIKQLFGQLSRDVTIPWKWGKDGCFARRSISQMKLLAAGVPKESIKTVVYWFDGSRKIKTKDGIFCWGYHTATAVVDDAGALHVFDPSLNGLRALTVQEWHDALSPGKNMPWTAHKIVEEEAILPLNGSFFATLPYGYKLEHGDDDVQVFKATSIQDTGDDLYDMSRMRLNQAMHESVIEKSLKRIKSGWERKNPLPCLADINTSDVVTSLKSLLESGMTDCAPTMEEIEAIDPAFIDSDDENAVRCLLEEYAEYIEANFQEEEKAAFLDKIQDKIAELEFFFSFSQDLDLYLLKAVIDDLTLERDRLAAENKGCDDADPFIEEIEDTIQQLKFKLIDLTGHHGEDEEAAIKSEYADEGQQNESLSSSMPKDLHGQDDDISSSDIDSMLQNLQDHLDRI